MKPAAVSIPTRQFDKREWGQFFDEVRPHLNLRNDAPMMSFSRIQLDRFFRLGGRHLAASEKARLGRDKKLAAGFNVFHFIEPDENRLSDVLAFLLGPKDAHGQGDLFLRLMLDQIGLCADTKHTQRATVRREAAAHNILNCRRRMDILVEAGPWLAIENKIDSAEQPDQVKDYLEDLHHSTRHSSVRAALIYLSPNGRPPDTITDSQIEKLTTSGTLHCWSYHEQLRQWLGNCHSECAAPKIRSFLSDLMNYIKQEFQRESLNNPETDDHEE